MTRLFAAGLIPIVFAVYNPFCGAPSVHPTAPPELARREMAELWRDPGRVATKDLVYGPWGREYAPDPHATYRFKHAKKGGASPGITIEDPKGREWKVKQGPEAQVEVVTSRVLSALGYHQPPIYFIPTVTVREKSGATHVTAGGRFRPVKDRLLKDKGDWSWQQNPFVGTRPYNGLLALLMLFDSSDLKNSNNTLYKLKQPREDATTWYVVRDLGSGLGETGRMNPKRNDPELFASNRFVTGVRDGFVAFDYHGFHQELFLNHITPADVKWACDLAAKITDPQWHELFKSAGYDEPAADEFIATIKKRIVQGQSLE